MGYSNCHGLTNKHTSMTNLCLLEQYRSQLVRQENRLATVQEYFSLMDERTLLRQAEELLGKARV